MNICHWTDKKKKRISSGFTLVEVTVVLIILAILAAVSIPSLIGFITDSKKAAVISEARQVYLAAQVAVSENCAAEGFDTSFIQTMQDGTKVGRITNNMIYIAQNNKTANASSLFHRKVAEKVLVYLNSASDNPNKEITFRSNYNPQGVNVNTYEEKYNQPGIVITYTKDAKVQFVEYGRDGYLVHIEGGECKVTVDGTFSKYPRD